MIDATDHEAGENPYFCSAVATSSRARPYLESFARSAGPAVYYAAVPCTTSADGSAPRWRGRPLIGASSPR
ncbi:MAG: hypothetical protein U5R31_05710 [Acidimicrobiia bacterium]|nr:hypothetical protein [Acidimicrobiia bacterium]